MIASSSASLSATPSADRFAWICAANSICSAVLELVHHLPVAHRAGVVGGEVLEQVGGAAGLLLGGGRVGGAGGRRGEDRQPERSGKKDGASGSSGRLSARVGHLGCGTRAPPRVQAKLKTRFNLADCQEFEPGWSGASGGDSVL